MHDHARRDDELAEFTDRLLAGDEPAEPENIEELASVVRRIHDIVDPDDHPSPAFRAQLTERLKLEWELQNQRPAHWWQNRRTQRIIGLLAASVALIFAAAIVFAAADGDVSKPVEGSALGSVTGVIVIVLAVVGIVSLLIMFRRPR